MKKVLIITERTLHNAPRVIREIEALRDDFVIHTLGKTPPVEPVAKHWPDHLIKAGFIRRLINKINRQFFKVSVPVKTIYASALRKSNRLLKEVQPDLVIVHEAFALPYFAVLKKKWKYKLVFHAHEYYPLEFDQLPNWSQTWQPYYENIYKTYLPDVDLFVNVCESIRKKVLDEFGYNSLVITNASAYNPIAPSAINRPISLIHHGAAIPSRMIEDMIQVARALGPQYHLYLMLTPANPAYLTQLKESCQGIDHVFFMDPVKFDDIIESINPYDIGLYLLPPSNYNNSIALPNKIFEFIQAKLCIAIGPSPEMANLVNQYQLGVVSETFEVHAIVEQIKSLTAENIQQYKKNAERAATILSAQHNEAIFKSEILRLFAP